MTAHPARRDAVPDVVIERRSVVNITLLVLRLVLGLLFMGHGLQKLVPARFSPPLLAASGPRPVAAGFEQMGMRPGLPLAVLSGVAELVGGFLIASGLVTPLGTALLAANITVAIVAVHLRRGIWATEGGFEYLLVLLAGVYAVSALGPGALSLDAWAGISDWAGVHWAAQDAVRAGAAVGIGAAAGMLSLAATRVTRSRRHHRILSTAR
jgi:putative oxidoreductase